MYVHSRLTKLRELIARLEQLAPSPGRDALLRRVRHRTVAVDAGESSSSAWSAERVEHSPDDLADARVSLSWVEELTSVKRT
jgi:hypothetical protein